jgi:hypothetical protein
MMTAAETWVTISRRRFGKRSTSTPAGNPRIRVGPNWKTPIRPSAAGESVNVSTSQLCASVCIQVPVREKSCVMKKMR